MRKFLLCIVPLFLLTACSNTNDVETGEIKTLQLLKNVFTQRNKGQNFIDVRTLINRERIDSFKIPVLFVELKSGQNGTFTLYPGKGVGESGLGADGAIITLENGILKATRVMCDDLMGGYTSMPM